MPADRGDRMTAADLHEPVTIRPAFPDDARALARLAALDSAEVPAGDLVLAEVDGELRAAVGQDGTAIADPFRPTAELTALLRIRAATIMPPAPARGLRQRAAQLAARPRILTPADARTTSRARPASASG
jgi:hypothetical protein